MKHTIVTLIFAVCLITGSTFAALADGDAKQSEALQYPDISSIALLSESQHYELMDKLSKEKTEFEGKLLAQLTPTTPEEVKYAIVTIMGMYRMDSCITALARYVNLHNKNYHSLSYKIFGEYPAADALVRIGDRSVPEMIRNIETNDNSDVRLSSALVIEYIYRDDDITKLVLNKEKNILKDEMRKNRIEEVLQKMFKVPAQK